MAVIGVALSAGCGSNNPKLQTPKTPPPPPAPVAPVTVVPAPVDPITALINTSQQHFDTGERELKVGHLDRARSEFDRSLDVLLESPYGARTDARLRAHFDRLVDRINAQEMTSLAQGDGFSEQKEEPASIDELLKIATFPKPPADAETAAVVKADLEATEHDIPIPQNSRIYAYVELFQGRLREYIEESLTRGTKYLPMIQSVFKAEGLPLDLAYIPIIESGFKTNALSKANAKGPWQFMRATAVEQGLKHDWYVDERSDPEKATLAAAKYLKSLYKMFNGDWHLVLAAYNGGLGRLQRAMKNARTEDFWQLSESSRFLPKETREYVPLILAAIVVAKNPVQYGFNVLPAAPVEYREGPGAAGDRPSPCGGVDRTDDRRGPGAESRAATLDDAAGDAELRDQGARGDCVDVREPPGDCIARPARVAQVLHSASRRIDRHDRTQAQRQPHGSGGSQQAVDSFPGSNRSGAPDSSRADRSARGECLRSSA